MKNTNIISFPESTQSEQRFRQIEAEQMMEMTQVQIDRILSFELRGGIAQTREQLRQYVEQAILYELMSINYQINIDTMRAIDYLARIVAESIRYDRGEFSLCTEEEIEGLMIPESDRFFLKYISLLHQEDINFQQYLHVTMSDLYAQRANSAEASDPEMTEDLRYQFIEIAGFLDLITTNIIDALEPYSTQQKMDSIVLPFKRKM